MSLGVFCRCESYRSRCGPPTGAEGAGRDGCAASWTSAADGIQREDQLERKCHWYLPSTSAPHRPYDSPAGSAYLISLSRSPLSICQVDRQSQYIQGYRLLYRPVGGSWSQQEVKAATERSAVIANLLKGTEYEIKIRPYFNEFQGMDSRLLTFRTPEEGEISAALSVSIWCTSI